MEQWVQGMVVGRQGFAAGEHDHAFPISVAAGPERREDWLQKVTIAEPV